MRRGFAILSLPLVLAACGSQASLGELAVGVKNDVQTASPTLARQAAGEIANTISGSSASQGTKTLMKTALCTTVGQYALNGTPPTAGEAAYDVEIAAEAANLHHLSATVAQRIRNGAVGVVTDADRLAHTRHMSPRAASAAIEGELGCSGLDFIR